MNQQKKFDHDHFLENIEFETDIEQSDPPIKI